jgi:hypothetical protein
MSGARGQAAGLAVGAAVGSFFTPLGAWAGGALGSSIGGLFDSLGNIKTQKTIDTAALKLNQEMAKSRAQEQAAIHAANFRQALASQVSIASMRGGSGSLATQFGHQAYQTFLQDQKSIERGMKATDVQSLLGMADINARTDAMRIRAIGRAAVSAFDGINLNAPRRQ